MKKFLLVLFLVFALALAANAQATTYLEDFEAAFPAWESGWLGTNSNVQNYYGVGQGRGNNPDGLWLDDGDGIYGTDNCVITFTPAFGATLGTFSIDVAGAVTSRLQVYDMNNQVILDQLDNPTGGYSADPGVYNHYAVTSADGISGFSFLYVNSQIEGNLSIDNVSVSTVPLPGAVWLFGSGLLGLGGWRRFRKS